MSDPQTFGSENEIGGTTLTVVAETVDRITYGAPMHGAGGTTTSGYPTPEALAGWLAI